MSDKLYEVMRENRASLEDEVFLRMSVSATLKNHTLEENLLRDRVCKLVGAFLTSIHEGPEGFVAYIEAITTDRIDEGMALHELQLALQVLEEKSWAYVVQSIPLEDQVRCLGQITLTIGTAKDHIACIYLQHLELVESAMDQLRLESQVGLEGDLNWQRGCIHSH